MRDKEQSLKLMGEINDILLGEMKWSLIVIIVSYQINPFFGKRTIF